MAQFHSHKQATIANEQLVIASGNFQNAENGHNIDRFQKAVEMLGSDSRAIREAGVFALEELVHVKPEIFASKSVKILCSFIRNRCQDQEAELTDPNDRQNKRSGTYFESFESLPNTDIFETLYITLMLIHGFRDLCPPTPDLRRINLKETTFHGVDFSSCCLDFSYFKNAKLANSDFSNSFCNMTNFSSAGLSQTNFTGADLRGAVFFDEEENEKLYLRIVSSIDASQKEAIALLKSQGINSTETTFGYLLQVIGQNTKRIRESALRVDVSFQSLLNLAEIIPNFIGANVSYARINEQYQHLFSEEQWKSVFVVNDQRQIIRSPIED